jgi:fluoroacetyl-CoA thioesterase
VTELKAGLKGEGSQVVTVERTAKHIGSGDVRVYATPMMALFIEKFCRELIEPFLAGGQTSVGVSIRLDHLAPTPMGDEVRIGAEVNNVEGNMVHFTATLWDSEEKIGAGHHTRAIVDLARFMKRVEGKAALLDEA